MGGAVWSVWVILAPGSGVWGSLGFFFLRGGGFSFGGPGGFGSGVAENWFTKPGLWEHILSIFSQAKQQNTEFTNFSLVRTPEIY